MTYPPPPCLPPPQSLSDAQGVDQQLASGGVQWQLPMAAPTKEALFIPRPRFYQLGFDGNSAHTGFDLVVNGRPMGRKSLQLFAKGASLVDGWPNVRDALGVQPSSVIQIHPIRTSTALTLHMSLGQIEVGKLVMPRLCTSRAHC